jgi:threonine aldolase
MLEAALTARTGDDVMGEDPTVIELEELTAQLFGKERGLYVPTGTMGNLLAILSHCHERASEIIIGRASHICLWEGGNAANLGGVSSRQIPERDDATFYPDDVRDCYRKDNDDHFPKTKLLCLENTHNMMGGVALTPNYITHMGNLARNELGIAVHIDGARIFNAAVAQNVSVAELCHGADSISVCLSKGLGAPLGSVLVGSAELIRLARRARKRCGGGMRQAGVVAAMGKYALEHHVTRLADDHTRAKRLAYELHRHGFQLLRQGQVDTNLIFFALPETSLVSKEELCQKLESKYNIKLGSGYSRGGRLFRAATHMDVDDEGIDRAAEAMVKLCVG